MDRLKKERARLQLENADMQNQLKELREYREMQEILIKYLRAKVAEAYAY